MTLITLFEYQEIDYKTLGWHPSDIIIEAIDKLNTTHGQQIIELRHTSIKAQQFVGILRLNDVIVQILPKIDYSGDSSSPIASKSYEHAVMSASRNLMHILGYAEEMVLHAQSNVGLKSSHGNWFELLIKIFAIDLHRQIKRGIDRQYVTIDEQSQTLRGTWIIQHQLRRLPHEQHQFDVRYDALINNTLLNQVFKYVVSQLLLMSTDRYNRQLLRDIQVWLEDTQLLPSISPQHISRIHFSRLNARFQSAFELAKLFLSGFIPQLLIDDTNLFAFVFDMNILFERFVTTILTRYSRQIMPKNLVNSVIKSQGGTETAYLAQHQDRGVFRLKPDITIYSERSSAKPIGIIDTKYKRINAKSKQKGVSEADVYQMVAYAMRYQCRDILLLYPQSRDEKSILTSYQLLPEQDISIRIATINLAQPLDNVNQVIDMLRSPIQMLLGVNFG